ncbi:ribosomal protection-like ABC-F family protein [Enterococcus sp. LJL120]
METLAVKLSNIEHSYGNQEILTIPELSAYQQERIGIVGANGAGKSTLLKMIQGQLAPEKGHVQREIQFNYFSQMENGTDQLMANSEVGELLSRFRVPHAPAAVLSGGETTKLRLAEVLGNYQMGLLLDEPTTHLDQQGIDSLLAELTYYYGTLIFVSHDRYFLDQLATKIWEVAEGQVREFAGNFSAYQEQKEQAALVQERAADQYLQEKQRLTKAIAKKQEQAQKAGKVTQKQRQQAVRPDRLSASKQKDTVQKRLQKSAKSLETRLTQLTEVAPVKTSRAIIFPENELLTLHNKFPIRGEAVSLAFGEKNILEAVDFQFPLGKKIAITGSNGAGKSTFLKAIQAGAPGITVSPKVVFSTYQQLDYQLVSQQRLLDYLSQRTEFAETTIRSILNNLGFAQGEITKPLAALSGGEATRVALALVFLRPANVLILDEPTNFIDAATISALEKLIRAYPGTLLFTSHDRYFVEAVAEEVYQIEDGKLVFGG